MMNPTRVSLTVLAAVALLAAAPARLLAHCDTLDGPVIKEARIALEAKDVTPVLKWVRPEAEWEVREAFRHAGAVRVLGPEARALADRFFFETLVRVHREGEGAPYTGLKPAGTEVEPAIAASDRALETGSADTLVKMVTAEAERGIRERFERAAMAKRGVDESVEKGRAFVAAYVEFMHYAERLLQDAATSAGHGAHEAAIEAAPHKH